MHLARLIPQIGLVTLSGQAAASAGGVTASGSDVGNLPEKQLVLINAEILRELQAASSRHDSMRTRATILVTAAGILATLTTKDMVNPYLIIGVVLSVLSGLFGMLAIWPKRKKVAQAYNSFEERLSADTYSTLYSIVKDNRVELKSTFEQNEIISRWLKVGFLFLVASWVATSIVIGFQTLR